MNTSFLKAIGSIILVSVLSGHSAIALVPPANDNPTGAFGIFNGNSTTGCSYDPYTANATRTIPDLVVANSLGRYPLTWARTMNSRDNAGGGDLGAGGGWRHSYQWKCTADESPTTTPVAYTVYYPDGRVVRFTSASGFQGPLGVNDRFSPRTGNGDCYLILSDGGQVHFTQTNHDVGDDYTFTFGSGAGSVLDPFNLPTTLSYDGTGRLSTAQDASGRFLKVYYDTSGQYPNQITKVDACNAAGAVLQEVTYGYSKQSFNGSGLYTLLTSATYRGDPAGVKATYSYQQSNVYPNQGAPLIQSCYDLRYPGPMKNIAYDFRAGGTYGVFLREKNAATNTTVVTLTITSTTVRTEQRGDGAIRTFTYGVPGQSDLNVPLPYELATVTDFESNPTYYSYDAYGHVSNIRDALNRNTSFDRLALTGAITKITLPAETSAGGTRSTIQYTYQDSLTGYFPASITNELGTGHTTTYASHPNGTVATTTTTYPDGGVETFTFNAMNQVTDHTFVNNTNNPGSGGTEHFTYDTAWRPWKYQPPNTPSDQNPSAHPTVYGYDTNDHLSSVQDPFGNITTSVYNERGLITSITYPAADPGQTTFDYYDDGTPKHKFVQLSSTAWAETDYTYDDYKRLRTLKNPGHPTQETTTYWYDKQGTGIEDYGHTESAVTRLVLPSQKVTVTAYDNNWRKTSITAGAGTQDPAVTSYAYDDVGNLASMTEPYGQTGGKYPGTHWSYGYDPRNRLIWVNDPMVSDPVAPHQNSAGHTVSYSYDRRSRKLTETPANDQVITYDSYDYGDRLTQKTVGQLPTLAAVSQYTWSKAGKLVSMIDPGNNSYSYNYDQLNRLTTATYPPKNGVNPTESYSYDIAGNIQNFTSRDGDVQTFTYDSRNREKTYSWSSGVPATRTLVYDRASRMTQCNTPYTSIAFTYYADDLLKSQQESTSFLSDNTARTLSYTYDDDGNRVSAALPNTVTLGYQYTERNQLAAVTTGNPASNLVAYTYDKNDNMVTRTPDNDTSTWFDHNAINQVTAISYTFHGNAPSRSYSYDGRGRCTSVQRADGKTDRFSYDKNGQVITFQRDDTNGGTDGPVTNLDFDPSGNRTRREIDGVPTTYTTNNLNQYATISGMVAPTYDDNGNLVTYNGWTYVYDSMNRLITVKQGTTTFAQFWYDGLNRQVARSITGGDSVITVMDGWNTYAEFAPGATTPSEQLVYGGNDLVQSPILHQYYYPDALGSTVYMSRGAGTLQERYTYDLFGVPTATDGNGNPLSGASVSRLFSGQNWYSGLGLYDLRNRFFVPQLGSFLQPDPIGFAGDHTNLYRYCGNNPANLTDTMGTAPKHGGTEDLVGSVSGIPLGPPHSGPWFFGFDGNAGAGLYVFNQGHLGVNLGGGYIFGGPGNPYGISRTEFPTGYVSFDSDKAGLSPTAGDSSAGAGPSPTITDADIHGYLRAAYDRINNELGGSAGVQALSLKEFFGVLGKYGDNDTLHRLGESQLSYDGTLMKPGDYSAAAINYLVGGELFAARDSTLPGMYAGITTWKGFNALAGKPFLLGGEFNWASLGYYYYLAHPPGG